MDSASIAEASMPHLTSRRANQCAEFPALLIRDRLKITFVITWLCGWAWLRVAATGRDEPDGGDAWDPRLKHIVRHSVHEEGFATPSEATKNQLTVPYALGPRGGTCLTSFWLTPLEI